MAYWAKEAILTANQKDTEHYRNMPPKCFTYILKYGILYIG